MGFYEEISKYYDYIFPTGKEQLKFIKKSAGSPPKRILDVACGTGGYSIELSKSRYDLVATDLDKKMIEELNNKLIKDNLSIEAVQSNMLEIDEKIQGKFDLIFCIGNSVVHLANKEEILKFFKASKKLIKRKGSLIIQIINFDRIIKQGITELPKIVNDDIGLVFERYYRFDIENNKIFFKTILTVEDKKIENEIPLLPLLYGEAIDLLISAKFKKVRLFGDFNGNEYDKDNSFMLVIQAK